MDEPYGTIENYDERDMLAGLPRMPFVLVLWQVKACLGYSDKKLADNSFRLGIDPGKPAKRLLQLTNIGTPEDPHWVVDYRELVRFCRFHRIAMYDLTRMP